MAETARKQDLEKAQYSLLRSDEVDKNFFAQFIQNSYSSCWSLNSWGRGTSLFTFALKNILVLQYLWDIKTVFYLKYQCQELFIQSLLGWTEDMAFTPLGVSSLLFILGGLLVGN